MTFESLSVYDVEVLIGMLVIMCVCVWQMKARFRLVFKKQFFDWSQFRCFTKVQEKKVEKTYSVHSWDFTLVTTELLGYFPWLWIK